MVDEPCREPLSNRRLLRWSVIGPRAVSLGIALLPALGCISPHWSRETVVAGADDVGRYASLHYHTDGFQKKLRIVCEDATNARIVIARRAGTGSSWGAFSTGIIDSGAARLPATAERPDGTLLVAYMKGGNPGGATGTLWLAAENEGLGPPWQQEAVRTNIRLSEPPAVAYEPNAGGVPRIHIVYSLYPDRELWHAYRPVDETIWKYLRVGAEFETPTVSDVDGRHPLLIVSGDPGILSLIYVDEADDSHRILNRQFGGLSGLTPWQFTTFETGWQYNVMSLIWGDERRLAVGIVDAPASPSLGMVGLVRAGCDGGLLAYKESQTAPPSSWSGAVVPTIPTDTSRAFCDPSFAFDGLGLFYISYYDKDAGVLSVYKHNPISPSAWQIETADSSAPDVGRYTSMVYDPLGAAILVAYYDVTNGDLKLAQRTAN